METTLNDKSVCLVHAPYRTLSISQALPIVEPTSRHIAPAIIPIPAVTPDNFELFPRKTLVDVHKPNKPWFLAHFSAALVRSTFFALRGASRKR